MDDEHDWVEVIRFNVGRGFLCAVCDTFVKFNSTRSITGCVGESRVSDKYTDPDKERPPVNERVKQELGFGLLQEYDWSDK